jgi:hypothetical protein
MCVFLFLFIGFVMAFMAGVVASGNSQGCGNDEPQEIE